MTRNAWLLIIVIAAFGALSDVALYEHGYFGIFAYHLPSSAGLQVLSDLVIACSLIMVWMIGDARRNGRKALPYLLLTLVAGSFGPLLYLLLGEFRRAPRAVLA